MNQNQTPWYVLNSPEIGGQFRECYDACRRNGVLDTKTKELIMTALSSVFHRAGPMHDHIESALAVGATREEVTEAILVGAIESAAMQLTWQKSIFPKQLADMR